MLIEKGTKFFSSFLQYQKTITLC